MPMKGFAEHSASFFFYLTRGSRSHIMGKRETPRFGLLFCVPIKWPAVCAVFPQRDLAHSNKQQESHSKMNSAKVCSYDMDLYATCLACCCLFFLLFLSMFSA